MRHTLREDANAILLPAFDSVTLSDAVRQFLDEGGVSILLGESRDEYVARQMNAERRATETRETIVNVTSEAKRRSGLLLAAVDQELDGICRLHQLVPQFPTGSALLSAETSAIATTAQNIAEAASQLGVNLFLSPVVDVLDGENTWLNGRTFSDNPEIVARFSTAYVSGVQRGGVAATAKHFPGFRSTTGDPAIDPTAECLTTIDAIEEGLLPFRNAISAGVEVVMVGPAIVRALDPSRAALRSKPIVAKLQEQLKFTGVVMADDLDSQATMRGNSVAGVAIDALNAGCDFLLLADTGTQMNDIANTIVNAVNDGRISAEKLARSANKVRALAAKYATLV